MKNLNATVLFLVTLVSTASFAATSHKSNSPTNLNSNFKSSALSERNLVEELTGKKASSAPTAADLRKAPLPAQHYFAGQRAAAQKNYILAIKHYNTVIQKYPTSAQAASSLTAKALLYKEMGLQPQAERNLQLAQIQKKLNVKSLAQTQNKNKIIK